MTAPYYASDAVTETYRHLMSGQRDRVNLLASDPGPIDSRVVFTDDIGDIQAGSKLSVDLEVMYVRTVSPQGKSATVIRGWDGSIQSAHDVGSPVYVDAHFTGFDIFQQLNVELADLCSPSVGLFDIGTTEIIYNTAREGYDLGITGANVDKILGVRYQRRDATLSWPRVKQFDVDWNADPTVFPSGIAVMIQEPLWPGAPFRVVYSRPFRFITSLSTDLVADCGLPSTATDIPPLGAAATLMFHKESKRSFMESQGDTRRAGEVPPGSSARAATLLLQLRNRRADSEANRISSNYPDRKARS